MDYELKYKDVRDRCVMLSEYEGRDYYDDNGESLYLTVKITEQDYDLLATFLHDGARKMEGGLNRMITAAEYTDEGLKWTLRTDETRWNEKVEFGTLAVEALASYVMGQWLDGRRTDRKAAYDAIFNDMMGALMQNLTRKSVPKRKRRVREGEADSVTITITEKGGTE